MAPVSEVKLLDTASIYSCVTICLRDRTFGLHFDVMNKLNAHGGLFVGQKAAAAAGAHV